MMLAQPSMNPALQKWLAKKAITTAKAAAANNATAVATTSKPTPASVVEQHKKKNNTPPPAPQHKRKNDEHTEDKLKTNRISLPSLLLARLGSPLSRMGRASSFLLMRGPLMTTSSVARSIEL